MTQHFLRIPMRIWLAIVAGWLLTLTSATAEPVPNKQDPLVVKMVVEFLQQAHLAKPEIGDEISRRLFKRFFKDLDPTKLYFLKSDFDEFKKQETDLDDMLLRGDVSFAYRVYDRFIKRVAERQKLIEDLIKAKNDFTDKEYLDTDYDKLEFAKDEDELKERWRKRIKFDLLLHRIGEKPLPEAEARQKVLERYQGLLKRWKQLDNYDLLELYLSGLTNSVDPHSTYMSPTTLDDFSISMRLQLEGIGAVLRSENGQTIVVELVPGGAAADDGRLKPNDKIIAVAQGDGKYVDVVDMKLRDVVKLIRGESKTKVQLKVVPAGKIEPITIDLTRRKVELKQQQARGEIIDQGKKPDGKPYRIGVIDLPSFYADPDGAGAARSATEDVRKLLKEFTAKGVDGVVLDLRHNGGGLLTEAIALTGLFIDQGPVVQVKNYQGKVQRRDDPEKGTVYSGPLMVLVSRFSASASEILAGALQDYGRALIVGDSATHGKGTVQMVLDLGGQIQVNMPPKLGALKLTIQQFYRVNGDSTQNRGVTSDIVLPSLTEHLATTEKELDYALAFDKVKPAQHDDLGLVPAELKALLRTRSADRVKKSEDFAKLAKEIELFKDRKDRKRLPLSEKELKEQFTKDEAEKLSKENGDLPDKSSDNGVFKFKRNFTNNEILQVMEDLLQGKKLLTAR